METKNQSVEFNTVLSHGSQRAVFFSRHTYYSADFPYWQKKVQYYEGLKKNNEEN